MSFVFLILYSLLLISGWSACGNGAAECFPIPNIMGAPAYIVLAAFTGAVVSVIYSISLSSGYSNGPSLLWIIGKPMTGVMMGVLVYIIVNSSLVLISDGAMRFSEIFTAEAKGKYFLQLLAFLGGFDNKFSQQMLEKVAGNIIKGS